MKLTSPYFLQSASAKVQPVPIYDGITIGVSRSSQSWTIRGERTQESFQKIYTSYPTQEDPDNMSESHLTRDSFYLYPKALKNGYGRIVPDSTYSKYLLLKIGMGVFTTLTTYISIRNVNNLIAGFKIGDFSPETRALQELHLFGAGNFGEFIVSEASFPLKKISLGANGVADYSDQVCLLMENSTISDGVIQLCPADSYYNKVKQVATAKGWSVEDLTI